MSDHSPEPWRAQPACDGREWSSEGEWFVHSGPWRVATVHAQSPGHSAAHNAHLIKASPAWLRTSRLQQALIDQRLPHVARMNLDDFRLLATVPQQASLAIRMASSPVRCHQPNKIDPAGKPICEPAAETNTEQLRNTSRKRLLAWKTLLPVARHFERQASTGSGGRRGGERFAQVRKIIREAEGVTP